MRTQLERFVAEGRGYLKFGEVARVFSVSRTTVRCSRGDFARLRHTKVNESPRVPIEDVIALCDLLELRAKAVSETPLIQPVKKPKLREVKRA